MSLDATKQVCKPAGVTLFFMIPAPQTQWSLRPEDVGSFEGTKPSDPAVHLAILLPTQHPSLFAIGMEDPSGDALGLFVSSVRKSLEYMLLPCPAPWSKGAGCRWTRVKLLQQREVRRYRLVTLVYEEQSRNPGLFRNPWRWLKEIIYMVLPYWQEGRHRHCQELGSGVKLTGKQWEE